MEEIRYQKYAFPHIIMLYGFVTCGGRGKKTNLAEKTENYNENRNSTS